jgi:dipeptidyl aminopeptidase/acylaminoacyl peptidase
VALPLALAVGLAPVSLPAVDIFLPLKLPVFSFRLPSVPLNEQVLRIPMTLPQPIGVQRLTLEATLYLPAGPGPFPLVVLSHGTPRDPRQRGGERLRYDAQSWEFVSLGFAVVIPMRRGYGHSEGPYAEDEVSCANSRFYQAGLESARDLRAAVEYVSSLPGIDPRRLVLAGHSSGGFASLVLASQGLPGVRGVINFGGGRGSKPHLNCSPDRLIEACARVGQTSRVPTLWVYSQNDSYFPPPLARQMCEAYRRAGGLAEFVLLPPFYDEGHYLFTDVRGLNRWGPVVNRFLNDLGFPGTMPRP